MKNFSCSLALIAMISFCIGCTDPDNHGVSNGAVTTSNSHSDDKDDHSDHNDDHIAPHGGHLFELGKNHEFHAELVDNHQSKTVTVYILDRQMKELKIDSATVTLLLTHDETTESFELSGSETEKTPSSKFTSSESKLLEIIEGEDIEGKLRITIDGKQVSGSFEHHSDEHSNGHDH